MLCRNCGRQIGDDVKACGMCGAKTGVELFGMPKTETETLIERQLKEKMVVTKRDDDKSTSILIISIISILVIILIISVIVFSRLIGA